MDNFILTERGKIVIAVVIVLLLLLLPSAILVYKSMVAQAPQPTSDPGPDASGELPPISFATPEIEDSPPPNGGGSHPSGTPPTNSGIGGGIGGGIQEPDPSPEPDSNSVDPIEGTLSFSFSPDRLSSLGPAVASMLDTFLDSPKNTLGSSIVVELPQLSDEDAEKLSVAVVNAFAALGVGEQRLVFSTRPHEMEDGPADVRLYYATYQPK